MKVISALSAFSSLCFAVATSRALDMYVPGDGAEAHALILLATAFGSLLLAAFALIHEFAWD